MVYTSQDSHLAYSTTQDLIQSIFCIQRSGRKHNTRLKINRGMKMNWTSRILGLQKAVAEQRTKTVQSTGLCIHGDENCIRCAANDLDNLSSTDSVWRDLEEDDIKKVVFALPTYIQELMKRHPGKVLLAGGFIRAIVANESPRDIDLFVNDKMDSARWLDDMSISRKEHDQDWATQPASAPGSNLGIQTSWRYKFKEPYEVIDQFDYIITKAAVWFDEGDDKRSPSWTGICHDQFYRDVAHKTLTYCCERDTEYLLSIPRLLKFIQRGYTIGPKSLADVITKTCLSLDLSKGFDNIRKQLEDCYTPMGSNSEWEKLNQKYVKPKPRPVEYYSSGS